MSVDKRIFQNITPNETLTDHLVLNSWGKQGALSLKDFCFFSGFSTGGVSHPRDLQASQHFVSVESS